MLRFFNVANVTETIFTDEKLIKLNQLRNTQNERVYAIKKGETLSERMKSEKKNIFKKCVNLCWCFKIMEKFSLFC